MEEEKNHIHVENIALRIIEMRLERGPRYHLLHFPPSAVLIDAASVFSIVFGQSYHKHLCFLRVVQSSFGIATILFWCLSCCIFDFNKCQ